MISVLTASILAVALIIVQFGAIVKDTKRYNTQSKPKTIQVLRAKE